MQEINCHWCTQKMNSAAIRCSSCGKLRKDIYSDKIRCYTWCILGGIILGTGIGVYLVDNDNLFNTNIKLALIIIGSILTLTGLFYYVRTSEKMKTYWWV